MSREVKTDLVITDRVRLNNNGSGLIARNAANTADISIAHVDGADELIIGDASTTGFVMTTGGMNVVVGAGSGTIDQLADELFLQGGTHNAYLSFYDLTNAKKLTLTAFAGLTADTRWVLPNGNGSAGQVLGTDGASPVANLSWVNQTGGGGGSAGTGVGVNVPAFTPTPATQTQMFFTSADSPIDTGNYTAIANNLTVPATGFYWLNINARQTSGTSDDVLSFGYAVNGGSVVYFVGDSVNAGGSTSTITNGSQLLYLTASAQLTLFVVSESGDPLDQITVGLAATANGTVPTAGSGASMSGGSQSVTTATQLTFNSTLFDTGTYTTTANEFIVPDTDLYTLYMRAQTSTIGSDGTLQIGYAINGGGPIYVDLVNTTNAFSGPYGLGNSEPVSLNQGDVVTFFGDCTVGGIDFGDIVVGITRAANVGPDGFETFALTNNEGTPTDITGLVLNNTISGSYDVWIYTYYNTTGPGATEGGASGYYTFTYLPVAGTWTATTNGTNGYGVQDATVLTVTNAGQVRYTTGDVTTGGTTGTAVGTYNFYWQIAAPGSAGGGGGSGTPAGSSGDVQFNNSGAFGADNVNFFWDNTNKRLGLGTNTPGYPLDLDSPDGTQLKLNATYVSPFGRGLYLSGGQSLDSGGNWTARGSDGDASVLAINRDNPSLTFAVATGLTDGGPGGFGIVWNVDVNGTSTQAGHLLPAVTAAQNIGSTTNSWELANIAVLQDLSAQTVIDVYGYLLRGSGTTLSIDWQNRVLHDSAGGGSLDWSNGSILIPQKPVVFANQPGEFSTAGASPQNLLITTNNQTYVTLGANLNSGDFTLSTGDITGAGAANSGTLIAGSGSVHAPNTGNSASVGFGSGNADIGSSGGVTIASGDAGTQSGDVTLHTGIDGIRGKIRFTNGTEGVPGWVWTSTDANGAGEWMPLNGGGVAGFSGPVALTNNQASPANITGFKLDASISHSYDFWFFTYYNTTGPGATEGGTAGLYSFNYLPIAGTWNLTINNANGYGSGDSLPTLTVQNSGQVRYTTNDVTNGGTTGTAVGAYNFYWEIAAPNSAGGFSAGNGASIHAIAQTPTINTPWQITFSSVSFDTNNFTIANPNSFTVSRANRYDLNIHVSSSVISVDGTVQIKYTINNTGGGVIDQVNTRSGISRPYDINGSTLLDLDPNDTVQAWIEDDIGGITYVADVSLAEYGGGAEGEASGVSIAAPTFTTAGGNIDEQIVFTNAGAFFDTSQYAATANQLTVPSTTQYWLSVTAQIASPSGTLKLGYSINASAVAYLDEYTTGGVNTLSFTTLLSLTQLDAVKIWVSTQNSDVIAPIRIDLGRQGGGGSGSGTPAGVSGDVQFNNAGGFGADSNFFWDNSNKRLGIGTNTPNEALEVAGAVRATSTAGTNVANAADFDWAGAARIISRGANPSTAGDIQFNIVSSDASIDITQMVITGTGNVGIGTASPLNPLDVSTESTDVNIARFLSPSLSSGEYAGISIGQNESTNNAFTLTYFDQGGSTSYAQLGMWGLNTFVVNGAGFVGINNTTPGAPLDIASTTFGANNPTLNINVTGAGGGEVDAIILNSDGNTGMRFKNTGSGTNGTYVGFEGGTTANFQINNGDTGKISLWTNNIRALVVNADTSISFHEDRMEINPSITFNALGPGSFFGNISDNDQTVHQVVFGSTDTAAAANLTSSLFIQTGTNTFAGSTANTGSVNIAPGEIVNGSGNPGQLLMYGGSVGTGSSNGGVALLQGGFSDAGQGGTLALNGGISNSGLGGNIVITTGTGSGRGQIALLDGTEGTSGWVWTSVDTAGNGAWRPTGTATWQSSAWSSNDATGNLVLAAQPAIVADSTLSAFYNILGTDVPLTDTVHSGASLQFGAGSVLEPTSTLNGGNIQLLAGWNHGAGSGGSVTLSAGDTSSGTGPGGSISIVGGNSTTVGGDILLQPGTGSSAGRIQFQDGTSGIAGYYWVSVDASGTGHWTPGNARTVRILNSGTNTVSEATDFKLLCDTTDASAATILLPPGDDKVTFRFAGVGGGAFSYTITPNGGDLIDPSAPTVVSAGTIVEYTYLNSTTTWYAS